MSKRSRGEAGGGGKAKSGTQREGKREAMYDFLYVETKGNKLKGSINGLLPLPTMAALLRALLC